jgi:hypothetical protein
MQWLIHLDIIPSMLLMLLSYWNHHHIQLAPHLHTHNSRFLLPSYAQHFLLIIILQVAKGSILIQIMFNTDILVLHLHNITKHIPFTSCSYVILKFHVNTPKFWVLFHRKQHRLTRNFRIRIPNLSLLKWHLLIHIIHNKLLQHLINQTHHHKDL